MSMQLENESKDYRPEEIKDWNKLTSEYPEIPEAYHPQDDAYIQAENIQTDIESELNSREDLRELPTVTIDPDYAHDHDDAVSLLEEGENYRAFVHIADVGHYVDSGSTIDEKAKERGVTFYLGDNTRHMLPRRLAQDICSLSPGKDSLAHTVEMEMNNEGEVLDFDVYKSVIESDAHLTYTHSDAILDSLETINENYTDNDTVHEEALIFNKIARSLDNLDRVTRSMRENRWDESLLLNQRKSDSSRIIEEMMVTANKTIGDYLREEGIGAYRVEEAPEKGWAEEVATEFSRIGYEPPSDLHENPTEAINNFIAEKMEPEDEKQIEKAVATKLPRAKFKARGKHPAGHFGLGTLDYAQFTSPIRRVTDLMNHRIVAGTFDKGRSEISKIAENASEQHKAADNAAMAWYDANT